MEYCTFAILILQICVLRLKNVLKSFILVIIIHLLTFFIYNFYMKYAYLAVKTSKKWF